LKAPKERDTQRAVIAYLKLAGVIPLRVNSGATKVGNRFIRFNSEPGCSDIIACLPDGRFAAIEVKRPGKKPTIEQLSFLQAVEKGNGLAWVVQSVEDVRNKLTEHGYTPP
jgi:hypothetical protein